MLKQNSEKNIQKQRSQKLGSTKPSQIHALSSGLNRRAFLRNSSATFLVASLAACKPNIEKSNQEQPKEKQASTSSPSTDIFEFTQAEKEDLLKVQEHLFPNDGDGPSAKDINALEYLQWALTDPDNQADGD
ncbi:MAG: hypothetical protein ACPGJI_06415, partial [Kangiellaceae bacterium]